MGNQSSKNPFIDWATTNLFMMVSQNKDLLFNINNNKKLYTYESIGEVIEMARMRARDFKTTETLKPFYLKSIMTLRYLLNQELDMPHLYQKYINTYDQITYENTLKLLLRCRLFFKARQVLVELFQMLLKRQDVVNQLKQKISEVQDEIDDDWEEQEVRRLGKLILLY